MSDAVTRSKLWTEKVSLEQAIRESTDPTEKQELQEEWRSLVSQIDDLKKETKAPRPSDPSMKPMGTPLVGPDDPSMTPMQSKAPRPSDSSMKPIPTGEVKKEKGGYYGIGSAAKEAIKESEDIEKAEQAEKERTQAQLDAMGADEAAVPDKTAGATPPSPPSTPGEKKEAEGDKEDYMSTSQLNLAKPGDAEKMFDLLTSKKKAVDPDFAAQIESDLADIKLKRQQALDILKERNDRIETAEVIELLGMALGQMAAGLYGMRHGVDMSGVRFQPSDWSKRYDRALKEYEIEVDRLETDRKEISDKALREQKRIDVSNKEMSQFFMKDYFTRRGEYQKHLDRLETTAARKQKAKESKDKAAEKVADKELKQQQAWFVSQRNKIKGTIDKIAEARKKYEKDPDAGMLDLKSAFAELQTVSKTQTPEDVEKSFLLWKSLDDEQLDTYVNQLSNEARRYGEQAEIIALGGMPKVKQAASDAELQETIAEAKEIVKNPNHPDYEVARAFLSKRGL